MHRALVLFTLVAAVLVATAAPAMAKACKPGNYPGDGYFTSLSVRHTSCAQGRKVELAHYRCRTAHGKLGKCGHRVLGYRCTERRQSIPSETDSRVTCKNGIKRVIYTYQQNT